MPGDVRDGNVHVGDSQRNRDQCQHEALAGLGHTTDEGFHLVVGVLGIGTVAIEDAGGAH